MTIACCTLQRCVVQAGQFLPIRGLNAAMRRFYTGTIPRPSIASRRPSQRPPIARSTINGLGLAFLEDADNERALKELQTSYKLSLRARTTLFYIGCARTRT